MATAEHKIDYAVGGSIANKVASLAANPAGPLKASAEHILLKLKGGTGGAGTADLTIRELEYVALAGLTFDNTLDDTEPFWHITPSRWTRFYKALDEVGMPKESVENIDAAKALVEQWIPKLPQVEKTICIGDVYVDTSTGPSWAKLCTPSKVRKSDSNNAVFLELRMMLPGIWTDDGRQGNIYTTMTEDIAAERVDMTTASTQRQAAAIIRWLRDTCVTPQKLTTFFGHQDAVEELQRRLEDEEYKRFQPLFETGWSRAYPLLLKLFDPKTDGKTVAMKVKQLAALWGMSATFVDGMVAAVCSMIKSPLGLLDVPSLQSTGTIEEANDARFTALIEAVGTSKPGAAQSSSGGSNKDKDLGALTASPDFKALLQLLDSFQTHPINLREAAKTMLKSSSAAGIMAIAGTKVDVPQFKVLRGVDITSNHIPVVAVFQDAMRIDKSGATRTEWPWTIEKTFVEKIVKGRVAFGTAANEINWWDQLKPLLQIRESATFLEELKQVHGEPTQPLWTFLTWGHQEIMLEPMKAAFSVIGYGGTARGSFDAVWRHIIERTKEIKKVPETHAKRMALVILHVQACKMIFDTFAQEMQSMHAQPVGWAVKQPKVLASGPAYDAWVKAGDVLKEINDEMEVSNGGLSIGHALQLYTLQERVVNVPQHLASTPEATAVFQWYGWQVKGRGWHKHNRDDWEGSWEVDEQDWKHQKTTEYPAGSKIMEKWGDHSYKHGVHCSKDFSDIYFGGRIKITINSGDKPAEHGCCARWYPFERDMDRWCSTPNKCKTHTHVDKSHTTFEKKPDGSFHKIPDDAIIMTAKHPTGGNAQGKDGGGGSSSSSGQGGGGGGRGAGRGGKGAKGKGKSGKGKGGKGKGKAYRKPPREQNFPRQR